MSLARRLVDRGMGQDSRGKTAGGAADQLALRPGGDPIPPTFAGQEPSGFDAGRCGGVSFACGNICLGDPTPIGAVPEPSAIVLGALGLAAVGCVAWRRRKRAAA